MKICIVYVDGEEYYASCRWFEAAEMLKTLTDGLGWERVRIESKRI
jgi:hypothetical protein